MNTRQVFFLLSFLLAVFSLKAEFLFENGLLTVRSPGLELDFRDGTVLRI